MKKILVLAAIFLFVGSFTAAFAKVPVPQANTSYQYQYQQQQQSNLSEKELSAIKAASGEIKKIRIAINGDAKNPGIIDELNSIKEENKKFVEASNSFTETSKSYVEVGKSQSNATKAVGDKVDKRSDDILSKMDKYFWYIIGVVVFCAIAIIASIFAYLFFRTDKKIEAVPGSAEQETIPLKDVGGHDIVYYPPLKNGKRLSLYVPLGIKMKKEYLANPSLIPTKIEDDKSKMKSSLKKILVLYFANSFNGETDHDQLQKAKIDYAKSIGILETTKIN